MTPQPHNHSPSHALLTIFKNEPVRFTPSGDDCLQWEGPFAFLCALNLLLHELVVIHYTANGEALVALTDRGEEFVRRGMSDTDVMAACARLRYARHGEISIS